MTDQYSPEQRGITSCLDYYKATMAQVIHAKHPDAEVTFRLQNRADSILTNYVDPTELQTRLDSYQDGWTETEASRLTNHMRIDEQPLFYDRFIDFLPRTALPPVVIDTHPDTGDITAETTGKWSSATFWETTVMAELNELYFENYLTENGLSKKEVFAEGNRRLDEKIAVLQSRPDIKFADFGTRRRFSYEWHRRVLQRLMAECPDNLIGTSNIQMAEEFGLIPIGTYAHELPMVYAALAMRDGQSPFDGQQQQLQDWVEMYDDNVSTTLTDTFGTDLFFSDMTSEQAEHWRAMRHDSGDPYEFAEDLIAFYEERDIDTMTKTIVFSDGLDIDQIVDLQDAFGDRINVVYGWGTSLTNDLGIPALKVVMKAVKVFETGTVKLSDVVEKYTGEEEDIDQYLAAKKERIGQRVAA